MCRLMLFGMLGLFLMSCAGKLAPTITVLPGEQRTLHEFERDDRHCRDYALLGLDESPQSAALKSAGKAAAVSGILAAAGGAAVGAATGNIGPGVVIGAVGGATAGAAGGMISGQQAMQQAQQRYNQLYSVCMFDRTHRVPSLALQQR